MSTSSCCSSVSVLSPYASSFAVSSDSSNCEYASKSIEKSLTVTTEAIASSYTSRACSKEACRMK